MPSVAVCTREVVVVADIIYDFAGNIAGTNVTTTSESPDDFSDVFGPGTAKYKSGGLVTPYTTRIEVINERVLETNILTLIPKLTQAGAAARHDTTPSTAFAVSRYNDVTDAMQGGLYLKVNGKYALADSDDTFVDETSGTYLAALVHYWTHWLDEDGNFQIARFYDADGDFIEEIIGPFGDEPLATHWAGIATTATHTMQMGPLILSTGTWQPPNDPNIVREYDFEGYTAGEACTPGRTGAEQVNGDGDMIFAEPGLDPDSPACAKITGQKFLLTEPVGGFPRTIRTLWEVQFDTAPTSNVELLRCESADGTNQCKVQLQPDGNIRIHFGGEHSHIDGSVITGETIYLQHNLKSDEAYQELTIYDRSGAKLWRVEEVAGSGVVTKHKIGSVSGPGSYEFYQDNIIISEDRLVPPVSPGLQYRIVGAVTHNSAQVAVLSSGALTARITAPGLPATPFFDLDADGRGFIDIEVPEGYAGQTVNFRIEASPNADGSDSVDVGFVEVPFAKAPGTVGTTLILAVGCYASEEVGGQDSEIVMNEAKSRYGTPTILQMLGDDGYKDPQNDWTVEDHIAMYEEIQNNHLELKDARVRMAVLRNFSDHDRMAGNAAYNGVAVTRSVLAWEQFYPHHEIPGRPPECSYEEHVDGRTIIIKADDRSNYRANPADPEGPDKLFLGEWQHERIKAILDALPDENDPSDDSDIQGAIIFTDMILNGDANAFIDLNKPDAIPNYSWARTDILSHAVGKRVVWISGDTHHIIMDEGSHNEAGIMTASLAGLLRNTGNLNKFGAAVHADYIYPPFDETLGRYPEQPTNTYGVIKVIDLGSTYTIEITARERLTDEEHTISKSWVAYDPLSTEPPGAPLGDFQFDLEGFVFGHGCSIGVEVFDNGVSTWRTQDAPISHEDGVMFGRDYLTPGSWRWEMFTDEKTYQEARVTANQLAKIWLDRKRRDIPGDVVPLRYSVGGEVHRVYGRPRRWAAKYGAKTALSGNIPIDADFALADHRVYADIEQVFELDLTQASVGGLIEPLVEPLTTIGDPGPREGIFTVETDDDTWVVVTFFGPVVNPFITVNGWTIRIQGVLGFDEILTIDPRPWKRSAVINDVTPAGYLLDRAARLDQMLLSNGEHELVFGGLDYTGDSKVRLSWRSTLIGF